MKELLYIHGPGADRDSQNYKFIQAAFLWTHNCECTCWDKDTFFQSFLYRLFMRYYKCDELVIIGDSIGGNHALQLRDLLVAYAINVRLILLNPVLNLSHLIVDCPFPLRTRDALKAIDQVERCFLLQSIDDGLIDHTKVKLGGGAVKLEVEGSHDLFMVEHHIPILKAYVQENLACG